MPILKENCEEERVKVRHMSWETIMEDPVRRKSTRNQQMKTKLNAMQ